MSHEINGTKGTDNETFLIYLYGILSSKGEARTRVEGRGLIMRHFLYTFPQSFLCYMKLMEYFHLKEKLGRV